MAQTLADIAIKLSADMVDFENDMGRASRLAKKRGNQMKRDLTNALKAITAASLAAGGALAGMVKITANVGDQMQKLNQRLGVSTEFLSQMRHAADLTDVSFSGMTNSISKMSKSINDADNGLATAKRGLDSLGISLEHIKTLDTESQFLLIADRLSKVQSQTVKTGAAMDLFGRSGTELLTLFDQGADGIERMMDEADAFGLTISQNAANSAAEFNDELTRLKGSLAGASQQVALEMLPALTDLIEQFRNSDFVENFADNMAATIQTVGDLTDEIVFLAKTIGGLFILRKVTTLVHGMGASIGFASGMMTKGSKSVAGFTVQLGIMQKAMMTTKATASGLMSIIGGPVGLALFGGYQAWQGISEAIDERKQKIIELAQVSDVAAEAMERFFAAGNQQQEAESFKTVQQEIDIVVAKLEKLRQKQIEIYSGAEFGNGRIMGGAVLSTTNDQIEGLEKQLTKLKAFQATAGGVKELSNAMQGLGDAYQWVVDKGGQLNANYDQQIESVDKWLEKVNKQVEALTISNEQYGKSAEQIALITAEQQKALTNNEAQRAKIDEVTAALIKQIKAQDALNAKTKAAEKQVQALAKAKSVIKGLRSEYKPLTKMFDDLSESMAALETLKLQPDFSPEQYDENFALVEKQAEQMAEEIVGNITEVYEAIPNLFGEAVEDIEKIDLSGAFKNFAAGLDPAIGALQSFGQELKLIDDMAKNGDFSTGEQAFYKTGLSAEFALNSMADMAQTGSDAQKKLQAAAAVTNTILGISAILEQGKGDPYTAFARMAAMAAMVASMGVQVAGAFSGSGGGGAEQQQQTQGTGTVLGDTNAKSESMLNAMEAIEKASQKIVGINSGMLRSLQTMNDAISGTVTQIAQGGEIGDLGTTASGVFGSTGFFDSIVFGGSKVTDRGIEVLGGSISDAINGDIFQAYEVAKRKGLFGTRRRTNTGALEDGITSQISLIFESMSEAVLAGAEALGVNMSEVEAALAAYQIEEQRISLMDLDSDEQQAQLQAVFSSIFDGLTAFSIPFITQFQEAGEGLGETLGRVSTTVLVFEEAIGSMGLDFIAKELDPELFAQAAVAISDFAGGMDAFIDGYTTYVQNFLSETEQMDILTGRISGIFDDLGLSLPETREGFTALIQGLDLTTEAGQEAFGTLIALSGQMDSYYDGVEDAAEQQAAAVAEIAQNAQDLADMLTGVADEMENMDLSPFALRLKEIRKAFNDQIRAAKELGATERELALIQTHASRQIQQAIAALESDIGGALTDLYGTELDRVNEQIALLESQQSGTAQLQQASDNLYESQLRAMQGISSFLDSILLNEQLSPLNPQEQLAEAQLQFDTLLAAAQGGDAEAMAALPAMAQTLLGFGQDVWASSQNYVDIFDYVTSSLEGLGVTAEQTEDNPQSVMVGQNSQMIALMEERNRLEAEFDSQARLDAALAIADQIRELGSVTGESFTELAERLGIPVELFLADLGVSLDELTVETTLALAETAALLGVEITDLAQSVGVSLGELADQNSLINDALESTISMLPDGIQDTLSPLLGAIEDATDPEQREALLAEMVDYIDTLPADQRDLLAPYFEQIDPISEAQQQIDQMSSIGESNQTIADRLLELLNEQKSANDDQATELRSVDREVRSLNVNIRTLIDIMGVA